MGVERGVRLTEQGVVRLQSELEDMRARRQELFDNVQNANSNNEASDSGEYEEIKDDLAYTESRVRELESIIEHAEIIERGSVDGVVDLGSHITVRSDDGSTEEWVLVSPEEASISDGDISSDSPVGRALLGTRQGDTITVTTPGGEVHFEVLTVK